MLTHTEAFKNKIKEHGKEIDVKILYNNSILSVEDINSVSMHYQGNILKSVMKVLIIDSNVPMTIGNPIEYSFGVKVRDDNVLNYRDNYDYVTYGTFYVNKCEKKEDSDSYEITCYDKIIDTMVPYESLGITYPISIRDFISTICTHLGFTFVNSIDTFPNYNKILTSEKFLTYNEYDDKWESMGYTFRDVLDQLAQVTASTICLNINGELELRYINNTGETIDEEYLKNVNVTFKEQYGPINTITLSRSNDTDIIYYPAVLPENPIEIKISDNEILNGNDRDEYLPAIYNQLNGLQFYLNDFSSTGICYLDLCDKYSIQVGDNTYTCVMLNDEINVTQGIEEIIYTDLLEESVTDYTKADKTDRKINQTTLIVDKQQGQINALVESTKDLTDYINVVEGDSEIELEDSMLSKGAINYIEISNLTALNLYPGMAYPSNNVYPNEMTIYTIILQNDNNYSETYVDLGLQLGNNDKLIVMPNKIVAIKNGTRIEKTNVVNIFQTFDDTTKLSIKYMNNAHIKCEYLKKNNFTTQFSTQAELSSNLSITDNMISSKVSKAELISEINQSAEEVKIIANKISLEGLVTANKNFKVLQDGSIEAVNGKFSGIISGGQIELIGDYTENNNPFINIEGTQSTGEKPVGISLYTNGLSAWNYDNPNYGEPVIRTENSTGYAQLIGEYAEAFGFNNVSLESKKKDFEKFKDGLKIIENTDIYKFRYKTEKDEDKKHIGLVIGDNYNYSKEVTNKDNDAVDLYSMVGVCFQAIKEQQQIIENLQNEIKGE